MEILRPKDVSSIDRWLVRALWETRRDLGLNFDVAKTYLLQNLSPELFQFGFVIWRMHKSDFLMSDSVNPLPIRALNEVGDLLNADVGPRLVKKHCKLDSGATVVNQYTQLDRFYTLPASKNRWGNE